MAEKTTISKRLKLRFGLSPIDSSYLWLRLGATIAALLYLASPEVPPAEAAQVLTLLEIFAVYSIGCYALRWDELRHQSQRFYLQLAFLDLIFVIFLMAVSGGVDSPFFRALFIWTSLLAFRFGYRSGTLASLISCFVFLLFYIHNDFAGSPWTRMVQLGGMLMHGPLIGELTDRHLNRANELSTALAQLKSAHKRVIREHAKVGQAEKLSSIGLLASGVAHEINNPLAGIKACFKALESKSIAPRKRNEYFSTIDEALGRIEQTVRGLLDYARESEPNREACDVADLIQAAIHLVEPTFKAKNQSIETNFVAGELSLFAQRNRVLQALVNVLLNAGYASAPGASIRFYPRHKTTMLGIAVEDEGCGMEPHIVDKIFDPFYTSKPQGEGTGLGMAVTLGTIRSHGGEVEVETEKGSGTTITLWLPSKNGEKDEPQDTLS